MCDLHANTMTSMSIVALTAFISLGLGSLDQDSLVNLEDFLRRGDHDGRL